MVGVVSMAVLSAALDCDLCQCGWLPKVASSSPQASVPGHVSLGTASLCVGLSVLVCVCVHMCGSVYVFVYLSVYLLGWEGWVLLIFFS